MLAIGKQIERYRVLSLLGEGGMAMVYLVEHEGLGTLHALKVLTIQNREVQRRMLAEGRVQANLRHPNIVTVTDVLDVDGKPGLLMEYIDGPALDLWLQRYRPTLDEALAVFRGILAGVRAAHAHGLVHRDLKPANVLLHATPEGVMPKVTDFGLVKASESLKGNHKTRTGTTLGTPAYMAPEQIRDASAVDQRADIYSLGCILYELVCGRPPYQSGDLLSLFQAVAEGNYPAPESLVPHLPLPVRDTIVSALARDSLHRAPDCETLLKGLSQYSGSLGPAIGATLSPEQPGARHVASMQSQQSLAKAGSVSDRSDVESGGTWQGSAIFPSLQPSKMPTVRPNTPSRPDPSTSRARNNPSTYVIAGGALIAAGVAGTVALLLIGIGLWTWWAPSPPSSAIADDATTSSGPPLVAGVPTARGADSPSTAPPPAHPLQSVPGSSQPADRTGARPSDGRAKKLAPLPSPQPASEHEPERRLTENLAEVTRPVQIESPPNPREVGVFSFTGARTVELVETRHGKRYSAGAPLPAGAYAIEASFADSAAVRKAGRATASEGEKVVIECNEQQVLCKQR